MQGSPSHPSVAHGPGNRPLEDAGHALARRRGAVALAVLVAVPVVLWLVAEPVDTRFAGTYSSLNATAVLLAVTGMTAFALNLVLGARLRPVEALFGGLDQMYRAHRLTGESAFVLLLGHVVLVLASRATVSLEAAVDLLGPGAGPTVFAGVVAFGAMTVSILLTLLARLGHEVFVYVQRSFGVIFLVGSYHAFTTHSAASSRALETYLAVVATIGIAAFVYRSVLGSVLVRRRRYRVLAVNRLDELVTEIAMEPVGRRLAHAPGQFAFVGFRSPALGERLRAFELSVERQVLAIRPGEIRAQFHPFSITSAPGDPTLRITVKALGDYTSALRQLEPGAEAVVEGPYGAFSHSRLPGRRQVWAAGGIGVTPFLSMARSLGAEDTTPIDFYYCVEHADEAHFLGELREIEARRADFRVRLVARDVDGFLTGRRIVAEHGDPAHTDVLVCGPPGMIESLREQLGAEGLPAGQFHAEEFSFAKLGAASPRAAGREPDRTLVRPSDARLIAGLGTAAAVALVFAVGVAVGGSLMAADEPQPGQAPAQPDATGSSARGRLVYAAADCGACHTLAAAGSTGSVGPNLDDASPGEERVRTVVTNGKGVMQSYRDTLTTGQIADVAAFVAGRAGR